MFRAYERWCRVDSGGYQVRSWGKCIRVCVCERGFAFGGLRPPTQINATRSMRTCSAAITTTTTATTTTTTTTTAHHRHHHHHHHPPPPQTTTTATTTTR